LVHNAKGVLLLTLTQIRSVARKIVVELSQKFSSTLVNLVDNILFAFWHRTRSPSTHGALFGSAMKPWYRPIQYGSRYAAPSSSWRPSPPSSGS